MTFNSYFSQIRSWSHTKTIISCVILSLFIINGCKNSSSRQAETSSNTIDAEEKLKELGITLPQPPSPVANYVNAVRTGNLIFLAGKGPRSAEGNEIIGKLGREITSSHPETRNILS